MKVLITGSTGQLGKALIMTKPAKTQIYAMNRNNFNMLNIPECVNTIKSLKPDWLINCGAYTNVDLAESQVETAMSVNFHATKALAQEIKNTGEDSYKLALIMFLMVQKNLPYSTFEKKSPIKYLWHLKSKCRRSNRKDLRRD